MSNNFPSDDTCKGAWLFNSANGEQYDEVSESNNLSIYGSPVLSSTDPAEGDRCIYFPAADAWYYITDPDLPVAFPLRGTDPSPILDFTMVIWAKPLSTASRYIIGKVNSFGVMMHTGRIRLRRYKSGGGYDERDRDASYGTDWFLLIVRHDNAARETSTRIYKQGVGFVAEWNVTNWTDDDIAVDVNENFRIGASTGGLDFYGYGDMAVVFNRILTDDEADDVYNDEFSGAAGIVIPIFMNQYRQRWN